MTADRMDRPTFELTQHFLAQMLAVRRTSVSEVARSLAEDGCITYTRGAITIVDRPRLRDHACDCYGAIRRATDVTLAGR
ncbi:helix-turn-helix domain-containing protein [Blastococcus sp. SYSU DS0552]